MVDNSSTFLGVNKHPNAVETWVDSTQNNAKKSSEFKALQPFHLENHFPNN